MPNEPITRGRLFRREKAQAAIASMGSIIVTTGAIIGWWMIDFPREGLSVVATIMLCVSGAMFFIQDRAYYIVLRESLSIPALQRRRVRHTFLASYISTAAPAGAGLAGIMIEAASSMSHIGEWGLDDWMREHRGSMLELAGRMFGDIMSIVPYVLAFIGCAVIVVVIAQRCQTIEHDLFL